ncbi:pantothenate kinase 3 isoform X5 [Drosophila ficusphila]|nr:pantothenate kinase 3 isoform X5 [Drosophila ficusphila]
MKVPTRNSKYSFNLKIFKLHNDKKPTSPSPPTSPVISAKKNSWRAPWRTALGSKSKSITTPSDARDPIDLEAEPAFFERPRCESSSSSSSCVCHDEELPAIQIPQGDELMSMPWFGMDIGGTLTKLVYFEPKDITPDEQDREAGILRNIRRYLTKNSAYGKTGHRDTHLQMDNVEIRKRRGSLHFIRFQTTDMGNFLSLAKQKGMAELVTTVCATGGGAFKFEQDFRDQVNMKLAKFDELDTLIKGILFADLHNHTECYYYENARDIL